MADDGNPDLDGIRKKSSINRPKERERRVTLTQEEMEGQLQDAEVRGTWGGKLDFMLSCIGYAVGLGNVWRFPYLCFKNGGGAFLFPYIIMLFLSGLPLFFLELAVGQFSSQGPITLYKKLNHYFVGIGWAMVIISTLTSIYYNVIIMWSVFYLFASFAPEVPWQTCDPVWAGPHCMVLERIEDLSGDAAKLNETVRRFDINCVGRESRKIGNRTLDSIVKIAEVLKESKFPASFGNLTFNDLEMEKLPRLSPVVQEMNDTSGFPGLGSILFTILRKPMKDKNGTLKADGDTRFFKECEKRIESPSGDYFHRYMLEIQNSDGIGWLGIGGIRWQLLCVFIVTWIAIFLCLVKGVASSGKVVYFTATFPYIVLIALLVRGCTLPGALMGIKFYIIPEWAKLKDPQVWADAATQIFYSLGPAFGGLLTFGSYNHFNNNCHRDAIIVSLINCGSSIFAGFAVFSILGFMAYSTGLEVSEVPVAGEGLLFIAYPEAIARMPGPPVWAILFFFMVFTLGLDSQFGMMETVISAIADQFHEQLRTKKEALTGVCCFVCLICGLPCVTYGGLYMVTLMNWYCASYSLMVVSIFNLIVITHIYGIGNFYNDIELMLGFRPNIYWRVMWNFLTPLVIILILIASAIQATPASYREYVFPPYVQGLGWATMAASISLIPIFFVIEICRYDKNREALKKQMLPAAEWGPALEENRQGRYSLEKTAVRNRVSRVSVTRSDGNVGPVDGDEKGGALNTVSPEYGSVEKGAYTNYAMDGAGDNIELYEVSHM